MSDASEDFRGPSAEDVKALESVVRNASRLVFFGLVLVAVAIVIFGVATGTGGDLLSDRRAHYAAIAAIVVAYLYAQRF